jgi:hypothetical protein
MGLAFTATDKNHVHLMTPGPFTANFSSLPHSRPHFWLISSRFYGFFYEEKLPTWPGGIDVSDVPILTVLLCCWIPCAVDVCAFIFVPPLSEAIPAFFLNHRFCYCYRLLLWWHTCCRLQSLLFSVAVVSAVASIHVVARVLAVTATVAHLLFCWRRDFAGIPSFAGDIPAVTSVIAVAIVVFSVATNLKSLPNAVAGVSLLMRKTLLWLASQLLEISLVFLFSLLLPAGLAIIFLLLLASILLLD